MFCLYLFEQKIYKDSNVSVNWVFFFFLMEAEIRFLLTAWFHHGRFLSSSCFSFSFFWKFFCLLFPSQWLCRVFLGAPLHLAHSFFSTYFSSLQVFAPFSVIMFTLLIQFPECFVRSTLVTVPLLSFSASFFFLGVTLFVMSTVSPGFNCIRS